MSDYGKGILKRKRNT